MQLLLILMLMFVAIYFFMVRPQQRKQREMRSLLDSLEVGDDVLTTSGIYGVIAKFDGGTVFIEVADGVQVKIRRDSIANKIVYSEVDGDDAEE